jgi:hypothetical protein
VTPTGVAYKVIAALRHTTPETWTFTLSKAPTSIPKIRHAHDGIETPCAGRELERRDERSDDHRGPASRTGPGYAHPWLCPADGVAGGAPMEAGWGEGREHRTREGDAGRETRVGGKTRLANAHEGAWQDVLEEAAQNSMALSDTVRRWSPRALILVGEGHLMAIEGSQAVMLIATMGVPPEIPEDGGRTTEGRLGVDDPVRLEEGD